MSQGEGVVSTAPLGPSTTRTTRTRGRSRRLPLGTLLGLVPPVLPVLLRSTPYYSVLLRTTPYYSVLPLLPVLPVLPVQPLLPLSQGGLAERELGRGALCPRCTQPEPGGRAAQRDARPLL